MIVLVSFGQFFENVYIPGIGEMGLWIVWATFGFTSLIVLLVFYSDNNYKATPRTVFYA